MSPNSSSTPHALVLAGPTASGKSAIALALAEHIDLEIISVDSAQVYRGMDIGTAKPSPAEQARVAHHLIDILNPSERYSAARFVSDARQAVAQINQRGRLALLVGGTMLYLKALFEGLDALPEADAAVRAEIDAQAAARGWPALHAELAQVDPITAQRLAPHDAQRIQRALEVWRLIGRPLSQVQSSQARGSQAQGPRVQGSPAPSWQAQDSQAQGSPTQDKPQSLGLPLPVIALEPSNRAWLHERIAQRFDAMLRAGLVDEVRSLQSRGDLHADLPPMRCVGYRQAWQALIDGDISSLRERGIAATRQLAKRQLTWLRSMQRTSVPCDQADVFGRVLALVQAQDRGP